MAEGIPAEIGKAFFQNHEDSTDTHGERGKLGESRRRLMQRARVKFKKMGAEVREVVGNVQDLLDEKIEEIAAQTDWDAKDPRKRPFILPYFSDLIPRFRRRRDALWNSVPAPHGINSHVHPDVSNHKVVEEDRRPGWPDIKGGNAHLKSEPEEAGKK
jgi:hypothetical protein